jgi:hypothetical protein
LRPHNMVVDQQSHIRIGVVRNEHAPQRRIERSAFSAAISAMRSLETGACRVPRSAAKGNLQLGRQPEVVFLLA